MAANTISGMFIYSEDHGNAAGENKNLLDFLYPQEQQPELCRPPCCLTLITYPGPRTTAVLSALTKTSGSKCVVWSLLMTPCMKRRRPSMSFWACPWVGDSDQSSHGLRLQSFLTKMMVRTNLPRNSSLTDSTHSFLDREKNENRTES